MNKKISRKKLDTPRRSKGVQVAPSPPTISCGKKDRMLLLHLKELGTKRLNIKQYSRENKTPRSSVYNSLNRLEFKGLVLRELADNKITRRGKIYIDYTMGQDLGGVQKPRRECREINKLSTHYHKFRLPISDRKDFRIEKLKKLNYVGIKENKLHNLHQIIVEFEDAKIIINPKQVIISLFEIIGDDVEETDIKSLSMAVSYAEKLMSVGVITKGVMVEEGHWARMESVLSNFLYDKVDKKYFLKLDNGARFFIDNSGGGLEDETDDKIVRQRVDNFLNQIGSNDFDLGDINKTKEALGFITKLEAARLTDKIEENKLERFKLEKNKLKMPEINLIPGYIC